MSFIDKNITQLNINDRETVKRIIEIQKASYRVEAEIIGSSKIPTLYDTVTSIQQSNELFIGYYDNEEMLAILSYKFEFGILDIHRLAVLPDHFKKGIACNLLKAAVEMNAEAFKVIVATGSKNKPAINLYEKLGFKIIRSFMVEESISITQLELVGNLKICCDPQRPEEVVYETIESFAHNREDIKAVLLNGSRVNDQVQKDRFQDYDIVCVVEDPSIYLEDQSWIKEFGKPLIMQQNDVILDGRYFSIFLIQFDDGNRIDIQFMPLEKVHMREEDTLELVLYDPDNIIGVLPSPCDSGYHTQKPKEAEVYDCINNILWCSTNVVKGICRKEFNYVKRMQEQIIRADLNKLMRWYIASERGWNINTGVFGKWMERYLTSDEWDVYLKSCNGQSYDAMWDSMVLMLDMAGYYGLKLCSNMNLTYPIQDEAGIRIHIQTHEKYR